MSTAECDTNYVFSFIFAQKVENTCGKYGHANGVRWTQNMCFSYTSGTIRVPKKMVPEKYQMENDLSVQATMVMSYLKRHPGRILAY